MQQFVSRCAPDDRPKMTALAAQVPPEHAEALGSLVQQLQDRGLSWPAIIAFLQAQLPNILALLSGKGGDLPGLITAVLALFFPPAPAPA
jgi:hypothetical protein